MTVIATPEQNLYESLIKKILMCLLRWSSWSSFLHLQNLPPEFSVSVSSLLFHASATKWHTVDLLQVTKNLVSGFGSNVTCCISAAEESVWVPCWALQPLHSLLYVSSCAERPAVMTSLCSAEHLQPGCGLRQSVACLCRWHLLPWGPRIISPLFSVLLNVNICVFVDFIVRGRCDDWEKWWEDCTHIVDVKCEDSYLK